jgi:hypothetical protein
MPGAGAPTIVELPLKVSNKPDFDLKHLRVETVQVMINERVVAEVASRLCVAEDCRWFTDPRIVDEIDLEKGGQLSLTMRIDAFDVFAASHQLDYQSPKPFLIKLRFTMLGDGYRSDLLETQDILVASFPE